MSGFFCNFCAFRFCFENHISFLQSCAFGFAVIIYQSAYSLPDEEKQKQEQRSLTLTDDSFTK